MFTIATLPKPFIGHIGIIQRNAIGSWLQLRPKPQIILFGNEEGTAEIAEEFHLQHIPNLEENAFGMPYLSDAIRQAEAATEDEFLCFTNCDILLFPTIANAFSRVRQHFEQFLLVGECMNLDVRTTIDFSAPQWQNRIEQEARSHGKHRGVNADYFFFRRGMYRDIPPLIHGRAFYDNWILYEARRLHLPVVDITPIARAIHQNHFYGHVPGETLQSHKGVEAHENLRILGGYDHAYWISDATHWLTAHGLRRNWLGTLLLRQRWKGLRRWMGRMMKVVS
ncbi:MAG: hypothetical protein WCG83_00855 [Candidatus Peregrinibacteria bacterium]